MSENQKKAILFDLAGTILTSTKWGGLVQELKDRNYIVGVCSGGQRLDADDREHLKSQGIDIKTDPVFMGADKDIPGYYKDVLAAKLDVNVQDIILVDDGEYLCEEKDNKYIKAAFAAGAKGIHFDKKDSGISKVRTRLADFGLLPSQAA